MRASKGAFSHTDVMNLTWRQFETYLDAFTYLVREESEKGRQKNAFDDAMMLSEDEGFQSERQKAIEQSKKFKHLVNREKKDPGQSLLK